MNCKIHISMTFVVFIKFRNAIVNQIHSLASRMRIIPLNLVYTINQDLQWHFKAIISNFLPEPQ